MSRGGCRYVEICGAAMCDRKTEPNFSMGERIVTNHMPGTLDPEWNQSFMLAVKEAA